MRALSITRYGGPEVLEPIDAPEPVPGPGEVAITVSHASVGLIDALIRRGTLAEYDYAPKPPLVPGLEVAGTVRAAGQETGFAVGDEVVTLTLPGMGGYADAKAAPADLVVPLAGTGVDRVQAVAGLANTVTAYLSLTEAVQLREDARVLVHGALGGLASVYPAVARLLGAREVVGTVRRPDQIEAARTLGFDRVVLSGDLAELADERFEIIVDPVGGDVRTESLGLLTPMGRMLVVGSAGSETAVMVDSNAVWGANIGVVGFNVGGFLAADTRPAVAAARAVLPLYAEGKIRLPVTVLPMAEAREAHRRMDAGEAVGRLVLAN
ncbi:quinone oxidoreductase family protein [Amycolatopsis benzoatilytica]|uniref:quinone oxidoreductase family protein n=1 Tax=Amycolatopsis benzoatilytica TaxID=346045 RepID=UPI000363A01A|nr:zinc-binding dehydrogenase [Amycolatopsis benzoatilytica]